MRVDADVAVVGAGPVGSSLAAMLAGGGVRTALLDRSEFPRDKACGEGLMPAGVAVLEEVGIDLSGFPALDGVTYRMPGRASVQGRFRGGGRGRGVRRLHFDELLASHAAGCRDVDAVFGCEVQSVTPAPDFVVVDTNLGQLRARHLVGADGRRSGVAEALGWAREPDRPYRYALVGHVQAPRHGLSGVVVTLLEGCETYSAPTGDDELLFVVLAPKTGLRPDGEPVAAAYERRLAEAHPELRVDGHTRVTGAGPFRTRPAHVAEGRVFLAGDAAGFVDPLTGDGMTAGLLAAKQLASLLSQRHPFAASAYAKWEAQSWRRRRFLGALALSLTGSSRLAGRALTGLHKRPAALERLLEVNEGTRPAGRLRPLDWAALAGF